MKKFYITTPLYYVNATPHLGHSYTNIAADCIARYRRQKGYDVLFLTGTDEHGQKVERAAKDEGVSTEQFVDRMVPQFKELWQTLDISYDDFIRTTEERHIHTVRNVLEILYKNGNLFSDKYQGWYCVPCETFWPKLQLDSQICPDCQRPLERIAETNYFFRLSEHQEWLIQHIQSHPHFIQPASRYHEALSFLTQKKLTDLCISRPASRLSWGIPLPFSPEHVTYVWFDALINYISAVGFSYDEEKFRRFWPADLHLIGKDILRQHAIYWPIILRALGLEPPRVIFAHGWWLQQEAKMSKSKGNVVDPRLAVEQFGLDAYRYFLLREVPFGLDGTFSEEGVIQRLNSDLANDLGNLIYRTLTMVEKYLDGNLPALKGEVIAFMPIHQRLKSRLEFFSESPLLSKVDSYMSGLNFSGALEEIWEIINLANKSIEETKPWILLREGKPEQISQFICLLVEVIRKVALNLGPFMPQTSKVIQEQLAARKIKKGKPLFPRITP